MVGVGPGKGGNSNINVLYNCYAAPWTIGSMAGIHERVQPGLKLSLD